MFRATTKLVQVSVIAQDQNRKPVADLRREEFRVFDNGAPREIRVFVGERDAPGEPSTALPAGTFSNQLAGSEGPQSGYSVILIDSLVASFGDPITQEEGSGLARVQTLKLLRSLPGGEKVAIYASGRVLKVICEFTSDRSLLERELAKWKPNADIPDTAIQPIQEAMKMGSRGVLPGMNADAMQRQLEEASRIDMAERAGPLDAEMEAIADHLAGIPGRKNLLWLSNRFAITGRAIQKFNRSNVSLYPVDMDGVCHLCPPRPIAAMNAIAEATGGLAFYRRNDINVAMREAIEDGMVSYTLGFYQPEQQAPVHRLSVRVSRPGVILRYRTGGQAEARQAAAADPGQQMLDAMNATVDATGIAMTAALKRSGEKLDLTARADLSKLDLELDQGLWKGKAEVAVRFLSVDGSTAGDTLAQTVTLNLRPTTYESMLAGGFPYNAELSVPEKAVAVKVLIGNLDSGKIGTLTIPLSQVK